MSNLVHRRRRCARIDPYMIPLPGWQYARGWRTGASHQAWVIVVALREPILYCQRQLFCFVAFRLPTADQTGGEVQTGKLACMDEHHRLAERA